jgi:hypothetical protein
MRKVNQKTSRKGAKALVFSFLNREFKQRKNIRVRSSAFKKAAIEIVTISASNKVGKIGRGVGSGAFATV